jgi:hypothetical protein
VKTALICALMLATPASAEQFRVTLGGTVLGMLSYAQEGQLSTLRSTLDNTPLGVFNGSFTATSTGTDTTSAFTSDSRSSRKNRQIAVAIDAGRVTSTTISPENERTDLSDPSRVPAGVTDPVRAIGHLMRATGCPAPVRFYDGRRVVSLASGAGTQAGNTLTCMVAYRVTEGPGHLSPLRISRAAMELRYATGSGGQTLQQIRITAGVFTVSLDRQD